MTTTFFSLIVALALFVRSDVALAADEVPLKLVLTDHPLAVTFTNTGTKPLLILEPFDGSEHGLIMPNYLLAVTDGQRQVVPFSQRCGLYELHPDVIKNLVIILPGETHRQPLSHCHDIRSPGTFTLQFRYIFNPTADQSRGIDYPLGLWYGKAVSNVIKTQLGPN